MPDEPPVIRTTLPWSGCMADLSGRAAIPAPPAGASPLTQGDYRGRVGTASLGAMAGRSTGVPPVIDHRRDACATLARRAEWLQVDAVAEAPAQGGPARLPERVGVEVKRGHFFQVRGASQGPGPLGTDAVIAESEQ